MAEGNIVALPGVVTPQDSREESVSRLEILLQMAKEGQLTDFACGAVLANGKPFTQWWAPNCGQTLLSLRLVEREMLATWYRP